MAPIPATYPTLYGGSPQQQPMDQATFELVQYLTQLQGATPSARDIQVAKQMGVQPPTALSTQQPQQGGTDYGNYLSKAGEKAAEDPLDSFFGNSATSAAGSADPGLLSSGAGVGVSNAAGASTTFSSGTVVAGEVVGSAPGGGVLMSTGATVPASAGTPIASGGAAGAAAPGAFSLSGIGSAGNLLLPAAGALGTYDLVANQLKTGNKKRGAAQGAASGAAMGSYFGPWGAVAGGVIGAGVGLTAHESTRDAAKRRTQDLLGKSDDPTYQALVRGMREQFNSAPPDPSKPYAGKYATFDEYKKAGLEAADLTGVESNLDLGVDYAKLTPEERVAFTQRAINEVGYHSKKGGVFADDKNKLKATFEDFLKNKATLMIPKAGTKAPLQITGPTGLDTSGVILRDQPMVPWSNTQKAATPAAFMIPRSKTLSPGIGLDGKPIPQWRK